MTAPDTPSRPSSHPETTTLVARDPTDLIAMVPIVLGFAPAESLVMLTFGAARPFHARVDLPDQPGELDEVVDSLLDPARRHRVRQVVLLGYAADERRARPVVRAARRRFERAGIAVVEALCVDGCRWHAVPGRAGVPPHGVPYDLGAHPFAAQAVFDGRVVHGSREELRDSIAADPDLVAQVVAALADLQPGGVDPAGAAELVQRHIAEGTSPDDREVARLLRGLLEIPVRSAVWSAIRRATGPGHVELWAEVLRRTPDPLAAAPAALLGLAAWLTGHGALAWCAVDRCLETDPDDPRGQLVADLLLRAVPPVEWDEWADAAEEQTG